jgi:hypothetical protein
MELIASTLDFLFGILSIDWRKLTKKERPKHAGTPAVETSTFLFVLGYVLALASRLLPLSVGKNSIPDITIV